MGSNGNAVRVLLQVVEEVEGYVLHVGDGLYEVWIRQAAPFPSMALKSRKALVKSAWSWDDTRLSLSRLLISRQGDAASFSCRLEDI